MSIQPRFLAHKLATSSSISAAACTTPHVIDLYLDYVCPYSGRLFNTVYNSLLKELEKQYPAGAFTFVFRQVVQPWHPSSTLVHEAALAVEKLDASKFYEFSKVLFEHASEYYDTAVYNETRAETYNRLATLASETVGVNKDEVLKLLAIPPSEDSAGHNIGNQITVDLKLFVRQHRQNSVHVTPTVAVDGIINNDISSGWKLDQWLEFLRGVYDRN
ncbi:hypothetical protein V1525DRAFT_409468 [Lipomyces kononenkoae]|uniref:Uncharacterized protein n=1 Tax=Lipomyces kononenkoae TaxID=34357 RepID=A0ACC3SWG3_LIPKO